MKFYLIIQKIEVLTYDATWWTLNPLLGERPQLTHKFIGRIALYEMARNVKYMEVENRLLLPRAVGRVENIC
jgi:hypothetical protein